MLTLVDQLFFTFVLRTKNSALSLSKTLQKHTSSYIIDDGNPTELQLENCANEIIPGGFLDLTFLLYSLMVMTKTGGHLRTSMCRVVDFWQDSHTISDKVAVKYV